MKVSIKTIKITSVISALSLVIALLMGAEYFKDASQIYLFGISWVTLQNTAFGIFGSAALAAVSAGIIYGVDKEAYLNKSEQYLIHVCTKSKTAFVQLTEANKILENGILSKNEKATFTGVSTIVSFIETQQEAIQPASMLEKMFPKNGSDVPDIRFKGFTKAWIKRKIGECFAERNESFPDGELLSVTINNGVRKFSELDRRDTSNSDKSKYKKPFVRSKKES